MLRTGTTVRNKHILAADERGLTRININFLVEMIAQTVVSGQGLVIEMARLIQKE
jgi:hypothetical protein